MRIRFVEGVRDSRHCTIYYNHYGESLLKIAFVSYLYIIVKTWRGQDVSLSHAFSRRAQIFIAIFQIFRASFESKFWSIIIISQLGTARHSISKYLFNLVTCIYKHNININIMVINNIICRANLPYNVTLYTDIANKHVYSVPRRQTLQI